MLTNKAAAAFLLMACFLSMLVLLIEFIVFVLFKVSSSIKLAALKYNLHGQRMGCRPCVALEGEEGAPEH